MNKVVVYGHRVWDQTAGATSVAPSKRTAEHIGRINGASIIDGTAEIVDSSALDLYGRYHPLLQSST
jgi:hypothetical protein